jgi:hypothetical protein
MAGDSPISGESSPAAAPSDKGERGVAGGFKFSFARFPIMASDTRPSTSIPILAFFHRTPPGFVVYFSGPYYHDDTKQPPAKAGGFE